jgi:sigma-B regulation protein RsbU (phosphoserine phosphatase)
MFPNSDEMTAVPLPHQPFSTPTGDSKPVLALKELVASLYREQNKIQNLLSSLGFALRSFNNLNQFLELTPLMAARVTDADGGILILSRPHQQVVLEQLHCQNPQAGEEISQTLTKLIGEFNESPSSLLTDSPYPKSLLESLDYQIRQALGGKIQLYSTPILVKNEERGKLYVFSFAHDYLWSQTRRRLLQLVADQTAVAMANNELTLELRTKERQDRELEIASEIQLRLFPRKCPRIAGVELAASCRTANRVGGDYYDFIPTNYDQLKQTNEVDPQAASVPWSIVIGDVMGKGVPAALIMTMTRGMLRAEVLNRHSPGAILAHLNRVMYGDLENSHRFVTLFYSEYDPCTRRLSYSNAAHHPPLLWQARTQSILKLDTLGMLIGLDADSQYEDGQIQLEEGDILVYYTDGFTDAVNARGDRFDEDNWLRIFQEACLLHQNPQEILEYLFAQVEKFMGLGNKNGDDMTLVVMRVQSP